MITTTAGWLLGQIIGWAVFITAAIAVTALLIAIVRPRTAKSLLICWSYALASLLYLPLRAVGHLLLDPVFDQLFGVTPPLPPRFSSVVAGSMELVTTQVDGTMWPLVCVVVFLAGVAVMLIRLVAGLGRLGQLRIGAEPLGMSPLVLDVQSRVGVSATWLVSDSVSTPGTFGYFNPVIVLPRTVLRDPRQLRQIACHELFHVRRGDWCSAVFDEVVRAAFWYHPLVWWLLDRISLLREQVVDAAVVECLDDRDAYAETLVSVAAGPAGALTAAIGWGRRRHIVTRVRAVMNRPTRWVNPGSEAMKGILTFVLGFQIVGSSLMAFPKAYQVSDTVYAIGGDVTPPKVTRQVKPDYTEAAMKQAITGSMVVSAVVKNDGTVGDVVVKESLDDRYGLDDAGVAAVKQWRFEPGTRQGKPVAVRVEIAMRFTLK